MTENITVLGGREFTRDLDKAAKEIPAGVAVAHRTLAKEVAVEARAFARGTGRQQAHFASSIYGTGSPKQAAIGVRKRANAVFWGAKKRTGWNRRNRNSAPQFPKWVGTNWEVGGSGGPLAINPAIRHDLPRIMKRYEALIDDAWAGKHVKF